MCDLHFDTRATRDDRTLFNEGAHDTESVMKRAICLLEDKSIGTAQENADGLALVWALEDFDNLFACACRLFDDDAS